MVAESYKVNDQPDFFRFFCFVKEVVYRRILLVPISFSGYFLVWYDGNAFKF